MHTGLTAPADVFHELPAAQALACGITAHLVDPSHLDPARAWRRDRHDRIDAARYTGWYADCYQYEILTGYVYAFEPDTEDLDDDEAPTTYYVIVESDDTDLHYLSPDAYDEPLEAALAADRMAELIAELERECDASRNQAAHAREQLAEGNRLRREAFAILRHVQACPIDGAALAHIFVRLYREAQAARRRGFDLIEEHRPLRCTHDPDSERPPTPAECRADAWRDGWECAAQQ